MSEKDYLKDISEIKNMMNKSSRFISLSGLSGVLAGIYALVGAYIANTMISNYGLKLTRYSTDRDLTPIEYQLMGIALTILILSVLTGFILSKKKAQKNGDSIWNITSKRLLGNFLIPLITGGFFCIILLQYKIIGLVAPVTLIFYGLALVNGSKYTLGDIKYLGITNIILGLIATQFIGYGLYFWALGFGVMHIVYGTLMYLKYDRK
ncbi:hypothetical protein [Urechidicola croceus]|uniref:Uncharacterized protein n=1 Tax=Urechidicola croceus TaxID=1850246 RepID=A0A1D8PB29_9FLAO|nr:hypothetical protein [Urechidicola croceus]AOW21751.1 hypothetical protein LPB138_14155 [Urechidicola croceus]